MARAGVIVLVVLAGCIERRDALPAVECAEDASPPTWTRVSVAVMQPSCGTVACHSAVARRAGVVLDSRDAGYASLVDVGEEPFVRPGAPAESRLMYLLAGVDVGRMMPPEAPLPDGEIELVARWICAGAEDD